MGGYVCIEINELNKLLPAILADKDDVMGWKKYHKMLKDNGIDVEAVTT